MKTRYWLERLAGGLLLGTAIASLEFAYYFPLITHFIGLQSYLLALVEWGCESLLFALIVSAAEYSVRPRELRGWKLALAVIVGVGLAVLAWQSFVYFVLRGELGIRLFRDYLGTPVVWLGGVLYHTWFLLFFGGLACAAYASQRRYARMISALRAAQLARAISQRRLADARLASLQARIEPDLLFDALTRLERFCEADPASADRLLDELITYLRNALADLRASLGAPRPHAGNT